MNIEQIDLHASGYVACKSGFYTCHDVIQPYNTYNFVRGINTLEGEIDSGSWAASYILSMYKEKSKDFILSDFNLSVNGKEADINELLNFSCYLSEEHPLFSSKKSVRKLVSDGLRKTKLSYTADQIKTMFELDDIRFEHPISNLSGEKFRAMAAIGYSYNKQLYCFPWLSNSRFESYNNNILWLLSKLEQLNLTAIVPVGKK